MRQFDEECQHALAVIDQTLAGDAVAPQDAELAELALILAGERAPASPAFAAALDERVTQRFAGPPREPAAGAKRPRRRGRGWLYAPGAAFALAAAAAGVIVISGVTGGSSSLQLARRGLSAPLGVNTHSPGAGTGTVASSSSSATSSAPARVSSSRATGALRSPASAAGTASTASPAGAPSTAYAPSSAPAFAPAPGRQVIRSAQISLTTRPNQVESVAQQVFTVVANQNGVVENSNITATNSADGYAQFQLSVPNANLGPTMAALSRLHGASVISRTDATSDVTGRVGGAGRSLADARAQRTALLRQLAIATTTNAIDSLKAQIRDVNASIASDLAALRSLQRQVSTSHISLTINAAMIVGHRHPSAGSGFTLGHAAHDAGRVLVVAAGVALIALAGLVPVALLVAIGLWLGYAVRRRRREQALDIV